MGEIVITVDHNSIVTTTLTSLGFYKQCMIRSFFSRFILKQQKIGYFFSKEEVSI